MSKTAMTSHISKTCDTRHRTKAYLINIADMFLYRPEGDCAGCDLLPRLCPVFQIVDEIIPEPSERGT